MKLFKILGLQWEDHARLDQAGSFMYISIFIYMYINSHINLPSITLVIVVSFSSGFNSNIHVSYKFVYFYFELLLSTDIHLPMNFFLICVIYLNK